MSDPILPSNSPNQPMSDNPASDGGDPIQEDPLLKSGSFIEPTFKDDHPARNGDVQSPNPLHEAEPSSAQSKRPFKPVSAPERPDWLPEGWGFDFRIRNSGVSAGTYDRIFNFALLNEWIPIWSLIWRLSSRYQFDGTVHLPFWCTTSILFQIDDLGQKRKWSITSRQECSNDQL
ncbi:uncharacterized protein LOC124922176 isoform X2 [Impatiens glandulifera]|uniref:uncharacterized protein LOC124922176 isoform X2 n=1 Tax=Impatiens glandulifera TaxID=253017 RepID=UPI001FB0EAE6|nr:uncharacterized protein LOC124922176 isoform X2 [Impatiens glandulifera]